MDWGYDWDDLCVCGTWWNATFGVSSTISLHDGVFYGTGLMEMWNVDIPPAFRLATQEIGKVAVFV